MTCDVSLCAVVDVFDCAPGGDGGDVFTCALACLILVCSFMDFALVALK